MNNTQKDRAIRKCQIAINKMIDLQEDFDLSRETAVEISRILDILNSLENRLWNIQTK